MALVERASGYCSTYQDTYRNTSEYWPSLPPIKYHQPHAFTCRNTATKLTPRYFPLIPPGPQRVLEPGRPLCPGLGTNLNTQRYLDKKPILKTQPPRSVVNKSPPLLKRRRSAKGKRGKSAQTTTPSPELTEGGLPVVARIPSQILDALCNHVSWTSTSRRATEEAIQQPTGGVTINSLAPIIQPTGRVSPPMTTFEENADMVKYRPARYEIEAGDWQRACQAWDRTQARPAMAPVSPAAGSPSSPSQGRKSASPGRGATALARRRSNELLSLEEEIAELIRKGTLSSFNERPCPRYAGFRPRSPVNTPRERVAPRRLMETEMQASYRAQPASEIKIQKYAHKGPFSRTVTLTYPYNAFNKVVEKAL